MVAFSLLPMKRIATLLIAAAATAHAQFAVMHTNGVVTSPATFWNNAPLLQGELKPVYVAANGNDTNQGTIGAPKATLAAAMQEFSETAFVIVGPGIYTNQSVSLSNVASARIVGPAEGRAVFRYGTRITNFVNHTNNIYKATNVSLALTNSTSGLGEPRVYEEGTASLPVTNSLPHQRGRANRLDHTFYSAVTNLASLAIASQYFYEDNTLYFIASDSENPSGKTIVVSSTNTSDCFVYGGQEGQTAKLEIANIEVEGAYQGANLDNVATATLDRFCVTGATAQGIFASKGGDVTINWPWIGATGDDGITIKGDQFGLSAASSKGSQVVINNPWIHDVFDKAIVAHERTTMTISGGLIENNKQSGIMAFGGGEIHMRGVTTRGHATEGASVGFGSLAASEGGTGTYIYATDCISIKDRIAFRMNPSSASQVARIEVVNATVDGTAANHISAFYIPYTNNVTQQFVVRGVSLYGGGNVMNSNVVTDIQGAKIYRNGSPESATTAPIGSMAFATNGGTNTTFYIKESGQNSNTGWAAK